MSSAAATAIHSMLADTPVHTPHEAGVVALHYAMLSQGFLLLDPSQSAVIATPSLYAGWNAQEAAQTRDIFTFTYSFGLLRTSTFQLKALIVANRLIVHALSLADNAVYSDEVIVSDEIGSALPADAQTLSGKLLKLADRLVTKVAKPLRANHTAASDISSQNSSAPPPGQTSSTPPSSSSANPDSRLFIPPRYGPSIPPSRNPLAVGEGDRSPFGIQPAPGTGMFMDPSHPIFGSRFSPRGGGGGGGAPGGGPLAPGFLPPGALPPTARFDPIFPPGPNNPGPIHPSGFNPAGNRRGPRTDPDPDHLPPPGYGDMFM